MLTSCGKRFSHKSVSRKAAGRFGSASHFRMLIETLKSPCTECSRALLLVESQHTKPFAFDCNVVLRSCTSPYPFCCVCVCFTSRSSTSFEHVPVFVRCECHEAFINGYSSDPVLALVVRVHPRSKRVASVPDSCSSTIGEHQVIWPAGHFLSHLIEHVGACTLPASLRPKLSPPRHGLICSFQISSAGDIWTLI